MSGEKGNALARIRVTGYLLHRFCSSSLALLILILLVVFVCFVNAQNTTLRIYPASVSVEVGQSFSINITILDVFNLYAYEFRLGWDPALLDMVNASEGPFLKRGGETFFSYNVNAAAGHMVVDCTLLGMIPGTNGDGTLATISFYVKAPGECTLDLYDVSLLNPFEQPISCQNVIDGYGHFSSSTHDIAITNISVSPLNVLPGQTVQVNVTAQNQGNSFETFNVTAYAKSEIIGTQQISLNSGVTTTIPFNWNTTEHSKGDYVISASASPVSGELDLADNNRTADMVVVILSNGHDVAVISVGSSKTIVGQGYNVSITVVTKNYGIFTETFHVTAYANDTVIQTQTTTLNSAASTTLTSIWSTAGWTKANYTISAAAETIPSEMDTSDNARLDGIVRVGISGDLNGDDFVGIDDVFFVASHFGLEPADPRWEPNCDITDDAYVGIDDIFIVALQFGEEG